LIGTSPYSSHPDVCRTGYIHSHIHDASHLLDEGTGLPRPTYACPGRRPVNTHSCGWWRPALGWFSSFSIPRIPHVRRLISSEGYHTPSQLYASPLNELHQGLQTIMLIIHVPQSQSLTTHSSRIDIQRGYGGLRPMHPCPGHRRVRHTQQCVVASCARVIALGVVDPPYSPCAEGV
jgi:hypothetical protein